MDEARCNEENRFSIVLYAKGFVEVSFLGFSDCSSSRKAKGVDEKKYFHAIYVHCMEH